MVRRRRYERSICLPPTGPARMLSSEKCAMSAGSSAAAHGEGGGRGGGGGAQAWGRWGAGRLIAQTCAATPTTSPSPMVGGCGWDGGGGGGGGGSAGVGQQHMPAAAPRAHAHTHSAPSVRAAPPPTHTHTHTHSAPSVRTPVMEASRCSSRPPSPSNAFTKWVARKAGARYTRAWSGTQGGVEGGARGRGVSVYDSQGLGVGRGGGAAPA